jgi:hypothetical protein
MKDLSFISSMNSLPHVPEYRILSQISSKQWQFSLGPSPMSLTKAKNCSPMYWHRRKINKAWRCPFTVHYSDNNFMGDLNHVSYQWKRGEPPCKRETGCRKKVRCEQWQDTLGDLLRESPDDFFFSCASDALLSSIGLRRQCKNMLKICECSHLLIHKCGPVC